MSQPFFPFFPHYFFHSDEEFQGVSVMWGQTAGYNLECLNIFFNLLHWVDSTPTWLHTHKHITRSQQLPWSWQQMPAWPDELLLMEECIILPPTVSDTLHWWSMLVPRSTATVWEIPVHILSPTFCKEIKEDTLSNQYSSQLSQIWYVNIISHMKNAKTHCVPSKF